MTLASNDHLLLDKNGIRKDVTQGTGTPTVAADEIAIHIGSSVPANLVQTHIGGFHVLMRYAIQDMRDQSDLTLWKMNYHTSEPGITTGGLLGTEGLGLYLGANIVNKQESHFVDRTFKLLCEAWIEAGKNT
jgi:hypothetical protein